MILYLETSHLVKLYAEEPGSEAVRRALAESDVAATAAVSYVEARAAFARKRREGALTAASHETVKAALDDDWNTLFVLSLTDSLVRAAAEVAEKHRLRAYDAIQLAAALALMATVPGGTPVVFSSADEKLREAARSEGLG